MKLLTLITVVLSFCLNGAIAATLTDEEYAKAEKYIIERKIYYAEDFTGTEPNGDRYGKKDRINETGPSKVYVSNNINNIKVSFYGETAVAHGDEIWVKKDGSTGRWVWTDVWVRRNGSWQMIAAQDADAPVSNN